MTDGAGESPWYIYASIPFTSAIVGWATNVVALKLTFWPLEFIGVFQIPGQPLGLPGWQGIIPSKAREMAETAVDMMMGKLIDIHEVFGRLQPAEVAKKMQPALEKVLSTLVHEIAQEEFPQVWEALPGNVRKDITAKVSDELPPYIEDIFFDLNENIEEVFDVKHMVVEHFVEHKELLNKMFQECGVEEFKFIEHSGIYFGLLFGLVQVLIWYFYEGVWVLPVGGLITGIATNWIALKMIFLPVEPRELNLCCWHPVLQGLFLKRQTEVSAVYARITAEEVLNSKNILRALLQGPRSDNLYKIVEYHVLRAIDETAGEAKILLQITFGTEQLREIKARVADHIVNELPASMSYITDYAEEALDIETTVREKMAALPPAEFEGALHPVFEQDEIKLVLLGGVLGLMVGIVQVFLLF